MSGAQSFQPVKEQIKQLIQSRSCPWWVGKTVHVTPLTLSEGNLHWRFLSADPGKLNKSTRTTKKRRKRRSRPLFFVTLSLLMTKTRNWMNWTEIKQLLNTHLIFVRFMPLTWTHPTTGYITQMCCIQPGAHKSLSPPLNPAEPPEPSVASNNQWPPTHTAPLRHIITFEMRAWVWTSSPMWLPSNAISTQSRSTLPNGSQLSTFRKPKLANSENSKHNSSKWWREMY